MPPKIWASAGDGAEITTTVIPAAASKALIIRRRIGTLLGVTIAARTKIASG
jgi:hypothetical protein